MNSELSTTVSINLITALYCLLEKKKKKHPLYSLPDFEKTYTAYFYTN